MKLNIRWIRRREAVRSIRNCRWELLEYFEVIAQLYEVTVPTINYHINKIFKDSELQKDSVIKKFLITADDEKTYNANHYSLEMIIAVGFKVNSGKSYKKR